jgi:hypothetical protein
MRLLRVCILIVLATTNRQSTSCLVCIPFNVLEHLLTYEDLSARLGCLRPLQSAYHDSQGAAKPCEPEAHEDVISDIWDWLIDRSQPMVYWMYGDRRSTTTAIAQRIASRAHQEGRLVSSFFFAWKGDSACRDPAHLIPTIMYKVARFDKEFLRCITHTISIEPDIRDREATEQVSLLVQSSFRGYEMSSSQSLLIVIDALDTCNRIDEVATARDISILILALSSAPLHFKVLITSRFAQVTSSMIGCSEMPSYRMVELSPSVITENRHQANFATRMLGASDRGMLWMEWGLI